MHKITLLFTINQFSIQVCVDLNTHTFTCFPSSHQLLRQKADINFTNEHGNTPLHYACFWAYQQLAEELIHHGALVSIANKDGDTPADKAKGNLCKRMQGESQTHKYFFFLN